MGAGAHAGPPHKIPKKLSETNSYFCLTKLSTSYPQVGLKPYYGYSVTISKPNKKSPVLVGGRSNEMDTLEKVFRDEYMGVGYIAGDALEAIWTDFRDTNAFEEYRTETGVSPKELFLVVSKLASELAYEIMSAPANIEGVEDFH